MMLALALLLAGFSGCGEPQGGTTRAPDQITDPEARRVFEMPTDPNILEVGHFYAQHRHWIWNADFSRVRGTRISALYLYNETKKGVFGEGIIRPRLYLLERVEGGGKQPLLLKEWEFDVDTARQFRVIRPSIQGYGYGLPLYWDDLDLSDKEIRIVVTFERPDGVDIPSSKKDLIVPAGNF